MTVRFRTPPKIARELGINVNKVLGWIARGELAAVNLAERPTGRPRWKVSREALDEFLASRTPAAPQPRKRRARKSEELEYYA